MFTTLRRIAGPATVLISILCASAHPTFGQSYTPSPDSISASVSMGSNSSETDYSSPTGGLPSISAGGAANVTFNFQSSYSAYQGGGATNVYYISDDEPTWTALASLTSTADIAESFQVSVSNLSTLEFKVEAYAETGQNGSANIVGTVSNISVNVSGSGSSGITFSYSGGDVTMSYPGATIFYTIDGSAATEGSIEYTGPVAIPAGTTIRAVAVQMASGSNSGVAVQKGEATVTNWKAALACTEAQCEPYSADYTMPTADFHFCATQYCNQGVQGIPTALDLLGSGSQSFPSASPQGSSTVADLEFTTENLQGTYPNNLNENNETQVLWFYATGGGCDSCTSVVQDFYIWPQYTSTGGPSDVQASEMDLELWDTGDSDWLNAGLQCSVLDGGWMYSGQITGWTLLKDASGKTLNHDCPLPSGTLSAAISSTASTFTVSPTAAQSTVEPGMISLISNEEIFCKAVSGNECTSAVRGYGGSTAAAHSSGAQWVGSVHVQYHASRDPGAKNCDSATYECVYIDYLNLNYYPGLDATNNDNNNVFSGLSVSAGPLGSGYPDRVFDQKQMDVLYGIGSVSDPVQVGERVDEDNVTASFGVLVTGQYTVP